MVGECFRPMKEHFKFFDLSENIKISETGVMMFLQGKASVVFHTRTHFHHNTPSEENILEA